MAGRAQKNHSNCNIDVKYSVQHAGLQFIFRRRAFQLNFSFLAASLSSQTSEVHCSAINFDSSDCDPTFVSNATHGILSTAGQVGVQEAERKKREKLKEKRKLVRIASKSFSNAPISFSPTALQQLIPAHHIVECCSKEKKEAKKCKTVKIFIAVYCCTVMHSCCHSCGLFC